MTDQINHRRYFCDRMALLDRAYRNNGFSHHLHKCSDSLLDGRLRHSCSFSAGFYNAGCKDAAAISCDQTELEPKRERLGLRQFSMNLDGPMKETPRLAICSRSIGDLVRVRSN